MTAINVVTTVILAAGYATRLYPLTENTPKCLLPVGGSTILDLLCEKLRKIDNLQRILVITNDRFFEQIQRWKERSELKHLVTVLNDGTDSNETRLGAIGDFGLALRQGQVDSNVLLLAGDNLFDQDLSDFGAYAATKSDALTVAVHDLKNKALAAKKYGVLEVDGEGRVLDLEEKPEHPKTSLIGVGVYYFSRNILKWIPVYLAQKNVNDAPVIRRGSPAVWPDAPGYFIQWLLKEIQIFSFVFQGLWYDIGDLRSLEEANKEFL